MAFIRTSKNSDTDRKSESRWLSISIQILSLISALLVNLLIPFVYGVEYYGGFIQANILVFTIQKFADIVIEPLMVYVEPCFLFVTTLVTSAIILLVAHGVSYIDAVGSQGLLAAMLLSSNCMLSMFALRLHQNILLHLILLLVVFFSLLLLDYNGLIHLSLVNLLVCSNLIPALISTAALFLFGSTLPTSRQMWEALKISVSEFPRNVSTTLVFNFLTNIYPYILTKELTARDLGVFRIVTSLLQSAASLFPLNIKEIFSQFIEGKQRNKKIHLLVIVSLFYFSAIGIFATLATYFEPKLSPYISMITILPVIYWVILFERFMQAEQMRQKLLLINLSIFSLMMIAVLFVKTLQDAEYLYVLSIGIYASVLLGCSQISINRNQILLVIFFSIMAFSQEENLKGCSLLYMLTIATLTFFFMKKLMPNFSNVKII